MEEPQSTNYVPMARPVERYQGLDIQVLFEAGDVIAARMPNMPTLEEMGVIDIRAITLSLASGIHSEVRYALDALAIITWTETRSPIRLELCDDLLDVILDCAEYQVEELSADAAEVSEALDLPSYQDLLRGSATEAETLQEIPEVGTLLYNLDRAADKVIAITTILRNLSFFECNHSHLTSPNAIKWLSNTIRLIGTRNMVLRSFRNTQDFYKDVIILFSNITGNLEIPSRDDALHILHFLLAFAPQPSPTYSESGGKLHFASFSPSVHKYLPPAVDCLAKLLARQDPNRVLYRSIFNSPASSFAGTDHPLDLLTRAFALAISVLPDRTRCSTKNTTQLRLVEARKAYIIQGMLSADVLASLAPPNDSELARAWIESEDGWAVSLLNLSALLVVEQSQTPAQPHPSMGKTREIGQDWDSFRLISNRALTMIKRLAEKANKTMQHSPTTNGNTANGVSDDEDGLSRQPKWFGVPQGHAILGALAIQSIDKEALGLLCGLHDLAMQQPA